MPTPTPLTDALAERLMPLAESIDVDNLVENQRIILTSVFLHATKLETQNASLLSALGEILRDYTDCRELVTGRRSPTPIMSTALELLAKAKEDQKDR